jgi:hypothetical protein
MDKLVRHHLASTDPSFHAEGQALQSMMDALVRLQAMVEGLAGTVWQQIGYLARHYDADIGMATWRAHVPTFSLDAGSIIVALTLGVGCWLVFHLLWITGAWIGEMIAVRMMPRPPRMP